MVLAWVFVVALHLTLVIYVELHAPILGDQTLSSVDFDTHAAQMFRVTDALETYGKHWAYDPQVLAGFPEGAVFDADNKGWELWTFALWKLGFSRPAAFNLFAVFVHIAVPWTVYLSARLFRLKRWEGLIAATLAMSLWFFDGMGRWSWFSGGVSYSFVTALFVLPLALFYSHLRTKKAWLLVPLAIVMSIGHLFHPSMFVLLVVPMAGLYARSFKHLGWKQHAGIGAVALAVVGANAWWLFTAFRFAHYVTDHEPFFVGTASDIVLDVIGMTDNLIRTGLVGNRTGFRILCWAAAAITLVLWRKDRDDRFLPLALGTGFLIAMAYFGGYFWVFRQIQPYRSVMPSAFLASIAAAAFVGELIRRRALHKLPRLAWATIGLCALLGTLHLVSDVLYFTPPLAPTVPPLPTGETFPITAYGFPTHGDYRHFPSERFVAEMASWVRAHDDGQGRFLVESWWLGEFLLARTDAQILGGFRERNMDHRAANLFHRYPKGDISDEALARYLSEYAVQWVIVSSPIPALESKGLLAYAEHIGPHRIYRSRIPASLIRDGVGKVRASLNRIDVTDSDPTRDTVLRYHWLETLVCEPDCQMDREPLEDNRVGFIRVRAPHPPSFSIVNRY
jgi:hypothetical protein